VKKPSEFVKDTSIDTVAGAVGAGVGVAVAGPPGALLGGVTAPILADVLKRFLSKNEKTRIQKAATLAGKIIQEKLDKGIPSTANAHDPKAKELFEGMLLSAKNSYEEKKIPFLANLFATAPFTNTPLKNIVQTLITAEQLSYRELCVIAVIGKCEWDKPSKLSKQSLYSVKEKSSLLDEKTQGIYEDVNHLLILGVLGQILGQENEKNPLAAMAGGRDLITPASLVLLYPGKLLFNGMQLDDVDKEDFDEIFEVLKQ